MSQLAVWQCDKDATAAYDHEKAELQTAKSCQWLKAVYVLGAIACSQNLHAVLRVLC